MNRFLLLAALSSLAATAACQPQNAEQETAPAPAPVVAPTVATETLDPKTLEALAFRAAWDAPPPVRRKVTSPFIGPTEIIYATGKLVPLGGDHFALISDGKGGDAHVDSGVLAIHYLTRTATGFTRTGAWPEFTYGGTFGAPPQWSVRTDLTAAPALLTSGGGTWQGYTCVSSDVIELAPDKPVMRADGIPTHYDSSGAAFDEKDAREMDGALAAAEKGRSFQVRYSGDRTATVTYTLSGDKYVATSKPDLLTC